MRVLHEVTECFDCPLEDIDGEQCQHPSAPQNYEYGIHTTRNGPPPDECPLRRAPLLLQLRARST